jgi:hypothetical protein
MVANVNPKTGIAYGYISGNALDSDLVDELLYGAHATNESAESAFMESGIDESDESAVQAFWDSWEDYEPTISGTLESVRYASSWLGGALNFWIFESPVTTDNARLASPCVPNVGILDTLDGSVTSYNVPDDWRCAGLGISNGGVVS